MSDSFYIVESIMDSDGNPKQNGRTHQTVGRKVCISKRDGVKAGLPCYLWYFTDWEGNEVHHFCHKTSAVRHFKKMGSVLIINTEQSEYKLREVSDG